MLGSGFEERFKKLVADLCVSVSEKNVDDFIRILKSQDKEVNRYGDVLEVRADGYDCIIKLGEPATELVTPILNALIGPLWPIVFDNVHQHICTVVAERGKQD